MAMSKPQETTEAHNGIGYSTADFLNHEMVDFADLLITGSEDCGTLNVVAGDQKAAG
jgi:hypothetical protein